MRASRVIVGEVADEDAAEVPFAQDQDVIQALTSDGADKSLCKGILPGALHALEQRIEIRHVHGQGTLVLLRSRQEHRERVVAPGRKSLINHKEVSVPRRARREASTQPVASRYGEEVLPGLGSLSTNRIAHRLTRCNPSPPRASKSSASCSSASRKLISWSAP